MKKSSNGFSRRLLALIAVLVTATSCGLGLDPAWKASETVVSVNLGSLPGASAAASTQSRAIVQGQGYLYVQTGISAAAQMYGPFPTHAGEAVTITTIPAGSYDYLIFYYSGVAKTSKFEAITGSSFTDVEGLLSDRFYFTENTGSWGNLQNVTIRDGQVNSFSKTLVPCNVLNTISINSDGSGTYATTVTGIKRKFIKLTNGYLQSVYSVSFTVTIDAPPSMYFGSIALYGSAGNLIGSQNINATISTSTPLPPITIPPSGQEAAYYFYIEDDSTNTFNMDFHCSIN